MKFVFLFAVLFSSLSFAHEGHDHPTAKNLRAPKGGVLKVLESSRVELVSKGRDLKIYIYDNEMKPQSVDGFKVKAQAELPRVKKLEDVVLNSKDNFFEGSFDAKGAHRYTLILAITDPKEGHEDKLKFTVEPRK